MHETRETVTDPLANAWSYACGSDTIEADDQCAWNPAPFIGSGGYGYQYEWSNEVGGCVRTHPIGPPFTISFNPPNPTVVYPGFLSQMDVSYSVSFQGGQSGDVFLQLSQDFCTTGEVYSLSQNHFTSSGSGTFSIWIFDPSTTGGGNGYYQCYRLMGVQDGVSQIIETDIFVTN